jgi:serine/threonine protein kinase
MSDWQQVQQLFLECVDLPTEEQSRFLQQVGADHPHLVAEVESLLEADQNSEAIIQAAVQDEAESFFDAKMLIGEKLGIYRVVREIGRGGMGSVYLAFRDDDEYHKEVALKVVRRGMNSAELLERFRSERQILANLEHPYIARLLDGGSTSDGVPFFVMEYIEGLPVDVFCREETLSSNQRCKLFLGILEAVAYAHRHLVVHRDLKPANILIDAQRNPKLLDFGIATLMGGSPGDEATVLTDERPFTPGYASPEQVQGLPITTATDIYSLGAILYELLSEHPAQQIGLQTPTEVERVVCLSQPSRPRLPDGDISTDLLSIVQKAMRKEPGRRYQSIDQFAADLHFYLQGRPVSTREYSLQYRLHKFVLRNRIQVMMAALVCLSLIVALVVSLAQTRRAEAALRTAETQRLNARHQTSLAEAAQREESQQASLAEKERIIADTQRDEARRERANADQRVSDFLAVANQTLFEVHDAIATLPGSMAARQSLVKTTLGYLENMERENGLDDPMRATLTAAYYKVAMIQGDPQGASLQDFQGAEANLTKAQRLLSPAYGRHQNESGYMKRFIEVNSSLADLAFRSGRQQQAIAANINLLPVAHRLAQKCESELVCQTQEATLENKIAIEFLALDPKSSLNHASHGISLAHAVEILHPDDISVKQITASLMAAGAAAHKQLGNLERAAEYYRMSIEAREALLQSDPGNPIIRRNLLVAYGNYASLLGIPWSPNLGRPEEARIYAAKAVAIARTMVAADVNNATGKHDLGMSLSRLGTIDPAPGAAADSLATLEEARKLIEPIAGLNTGSAETANQIASIAEYEGHRQEELGRYPDAIESYQRSMSILSPFLDARNSSVIAQFLASEQSLAIAFAISGDYASALSTANHNVERAAKSSDQASQSDVTLARLACAWSILADVQDRAGMREKAQHSAETAMRFWRPIRNPGVLSANRTVLTRVQTLISQ